MIVVESGQYNISTKCVQKLFLCFPILGINFIIRLYLFTFFLQNTGGLADIVAQLCRKLLPTDELAQFRKRTYIKKCKEELERLFDKSKNTKQDDEIKIEDPVIEIEKYVDVLNEMEALIVVFDAIEHSGNLEDAIANAMLTDIKYRVENLEQFFRPETRSAELAWCLVRSSFRSNGK